jgi:hypothetical protein
VISLLSNSTEREIELTTDTEVRCIGLHSKDDYAYIKIAHRILGNYMESIGVKHWTVEHWQSIIWYDKKVRVIPYQMQIEGKDKFIYELHGGFRTCYEYMFRKLDEEHIVHNGIPI